MTPDATPTPPVICDAAADARFRALVRGSGKNPDDPWIGGYVAYEWGHGRHVWECRRGPTAGAQVLEYGCNYGGSAIVLAALGARVTAVDIDAQVLEIARLNAQRHGLAECIDFVLLNDRMSLPFASSAFDRIVCNSVLEYVDADRLPVVQRELDRILAPGGLLFVTATSNRLWPVEMHSRRWLSNYLPRATERLVGGTTLQRGVWPWQVRYGFGRYENLDWLDGGAAYLDARARIEGEGITLQILRCGMRVARLLGISIGLLTPYLSVTLRKPAASLGAQDAHVVADPMRTGQIRDVHPTVDRIYGGQPTPALARCHRTVVSDAVCRSSCALMWPPSRITSTVT